MYRGPTPKDGAALQGAPTLTPCRCARFLLLGALLVLLADLDALALDETAVPVSHCCSVGLPSAPELNWVNRSS